MIKLLNFNIYLLLSKYTYFIQISNLKILGFFSFLPFRKKEIEKSKIIYDFIIQERNFVSQPLLRYLINNRENFRKIPLNLAQTCLQHLNCLP